MTWSIVETACELQADYGEDGWLWYGPMEDAFREETCEDAIAHLESCCRAILDYEQDENPADNDWDWDTARYWTPDILSDVAHHFRENGKEDWAQECEKMEMIEHLCAH